MLYPAKAKENRMPTTLMTLAILELLTLLAVLALFLRKPASSTPQDPRLSQLPDALLRHETRLEARLEAIEDTLRAGLEALNAALRNDLATQRNDLAVHRADASTQAVALREEVERSVRHLSTTLATGLDTVRTDNRAAAETLRLAVSNDLTAIGQRLSNFINEANRAQIEARESLHTRLASLSQDNAAHQEKLRATVGDSLNKLNTDNAAKLEEMRATVDEKLHATLHTRLTESFGQVTDQLNKVHTGLGEMSKLSEGVDGLSRIFTNVKSRGGFAEVQLGMLLDQVLAPGQFIRNASVKPGSQQIVEFAVRFPAQHGETLLPIDAKFPREDWERLEEAYSSNVPEQITSAGRSFEAAIRTEGRRICDKYINEPVTTPYAIMFLPTEGLYAEVVRRGALQAELQSDCRVTIAGPATLFAILTSFRMGFHMLNLQEKGDDVWKVLQSTKTEFGKFGDLMTKMEKNVNTVQNTMHDLGVRTRAINRTLRDVSDPSTLPFVPPLELEDYAGVAPRLAAAEDE
jgi:DNA recombination protein RmuC